MLAIREKTNIFAPQLRTIVRQFAQVAESVDALVSNTSGFTSIPVRPRAWVLRKAVNRKIDGLFLFTDNSSDSQGVAPKETNSFPLRP